ncbi:MAG TPA: division plane positioning ATPase MipZ, partial [Burkholderiales bacterium]|nr:division plane positioning ATPase MipZ [Burkholderiales bacterium]
MTMGAALKKPDVVRLAASGAGQGDAHIIVFGNEKGGTGKTTTAMHIAVALGRLGKTVAAIDLDGRQRSFARYIQNRADFVARTGHDLPVPKAQVVERAKAGTLDPAADENKRFDEALAHAREGADFVVIDTPGNDTNLSRAGHASADTLVTPMNDSFLDFDLLAKFDAETLDIKGPSLYSEFVWECRKRRLMARRANLDWVVMRNRVAAVEARNKRRVSGALNRLSTRIGCRVAPGFSERVIFRELFPMGLTMLDLPLPRLAVPLTMSHVAARQEVRELLAIL